MSAPKGRSISLYFPPDVAGVLDEQDNASAYVTETIRLRRRGEATAAMLRETGYLVTPEGKARMRARLDALDAQNAAAGE